MEFVDLLERAEQLRAELEEGPRVERNLRQIVDAGRQLFTRTSAHSRDAQDIRASILLGSKGYDLPKVSQKMSSLPASHTFEPIEPVRETDIQGFLKNERENAMLSVIEESKKATFARAERSLWTTLLGEWEREKARILSALAGPSLHDSPLISGDAKSFLSETMNLRTRSAMDKLEVMYAKELGSYNEQAMRGGSKCFLAEKFHQIFREMDDKASCELWELCAWMGDVPLRAEGDVLAARGAPLAQAALVSRARSYLQTKYFEYVQGYVYGNLMQAQLGPRPGAYFVVCGYLKIRMPMPPAGLEDGTVDGSPVWAVIYFCLRCGKLDAATTAARNAGDSLRDFVPILIEYEENEGSRLKPSTENQIQLQYRRTVRASTDPYKRAVYCVLGSCASEETPAEVTEKTDDYLWVKLCQMRPEQLPELQSTLLEEYGEAHFEAERQPHLYARVLWLTGQFEAAVEFLFRVSEALRPHALHLAVALHEAGLLALPADPAAPLLSRASSDKAPMRRLNLSRLIMMYTKKFEATDPREALQYFYVLRDLRSSKGKNLFMACVSELVLESKEYEMLLGKIEPDGCRKAGAVDKFLVETRALTEAVAGDAEARGLYEDAVRLYDLAGKHEKVLEMLSKLLGQVAAQAQVPGSHRQRLEDIAHSIAHRYKTQGHTANTDVAGTFYLLLDLMAFFNYYHKNQHVEALDTMKSLKLLPFESQEMEQKVSAFSTYSEEIRRNFPDVLLATMNILYSEYKNIKQSTSSHDSRYLNESISQEKRVVRVRAHASCLITFAGMIPYRMPGDTSARLVQVEVLMT